MNSLPDRNTFESAYAGQAPWDIGRPQQAFLDVADRITGRQLTLRQTGFPRLSSEHYLGELLLVCGKSQTRGDLCRPYPTGGTGARNLL
jgi:hypothetical protein